MKKLMNTNAYDVESEILICGKCLIKNDADGFKKLLKMYPHAYNVCLAETLLNDVVSKIGEMVSTGKVKRMVFATIDRSSSCIQLHYIRKEITKRLKDIGSFEIINYVVSNGNLVEISGGAISLSKNLIELQRIFESREIDE